ncbi:MAG: hypothetical protein FJ314_04190 [SAR202 cluster bacterium]|nr:hypothetical protein [SAR202 cluster bacterium]
MRNNGASAVSWGSAHGRCAHRRIISAVSASAALLLIACSTVDQAREAGPSHETAAGSLIPDGGARVVMADREITIDELERAGYKKSKQLAYESLPGARAAWYGFFNRRDIEVRFYETHAAALELGVAPAYEATQAPKRRGGGDRGAGHEGITGYNAYLVAGNLVMLCEVEVASCEALLAALK